MALSEVWWLRTMLAMDVGDLDGADAAISAARTYRLVSGDSDLSDIDFLAASIDVIRGAWSTPLDPRIEPERKAKGDYTNSRAVIDACRPWHWRDQFPAVNMPSAEERREALAKFGHLLKS